MHASLSSLVESSIEIITLMMWARICDTPCLDVSRAQIFQALFGFSLYLLYIKTLKESAPSMTWMRIPANPTSSHEAMGSSALIIDNIIWTET